MIFIGIKEQFWRDVLRPLFNAILPNVKTVLGNVVTDWSRAQTQTLFQQLNGGVRYFDLRICWDNNKDENGEFRACHGVFGSSLNTVLDQVATFVNDPNNQKEIIIIDLATLAMNNDQANFVLGRLHEKLGSRLVAAERANQLDTLTVNDLWRDGRQVIVLYDDTCSPSGCFTGSTWRPWPKSVMEFPWNRVRTTKTGDYKMYAEADLIKSSVVEERMALALENRDQSKLLGVGTNRTPPVDYIIHSAVSCTIDQLGLRSVVGLDLLVKELEKQGIIKPHEACSLEELGAKGASRMDLAMTWWAKGEHAARGNMNVIAVDTYEAVNLVPYALRMNAGPVLAAALTAGGAPYAPGTWTNKDVVVGFRCATQPAIALPYPTGYSTQSAINSIDLTPAGGATQPFTGGTASLTLDTTKENQGVTAKCLDANGKVARLTVSDIDIDKTPPTITPASRTPGPDANGWNKTDVTATWTCGDAHSGAVAASDSKVVSTEGAGQSATGTCTDKAGNTATHTVSDIKIDKTAPTITFDGRTAPNAAGWNNADVTLTWRCADTLSGPASGTVTRTLSTEGASQSATGECADKAGNTAANTQSGVNIDKTKPVITASAKTADGKLYTAGTWTNQDVTVTFACTDALSEVVSVSMPVTLSKDGADQSAAGTCTDKAGNGANTTFADVDLDKTAPVLTCSVTPDKLWPPDHKLVAVTVSVASTDAGSSVAEYKLVAATSTEPDSGLDKDDIANDIQDFAIGTADTTGQLRAERSGTGTGRVYTLTYEGADKVGNTSTCKVTVSVPLDQGR